MRRVGLKEDIVGKRFGRLVVLSRAENINRARAWNCLCDCGNVCIRRTAQLTFPHYSQSCGCVRLEKLATQNKARRKYDIIPRAEYNTWFNIKDRCYNPNSVSYPLYGGRGISVCDEWVNDFKQFFVDMGRRPGPGYSIDRVDPNGNYEPSNCRWATQKEQQNNRRDNVFVEFNGEKLSVSQWAVKYNLSPDTLSYRLKAGWDIKKALTQPVQKQKGKNC